MKQLSTIEIDLLPEGARKEIVDFYEYLLNKYSTRKIEFKKDTPVKKKIGRQSSKLFFKKIEAFTFNLPGDYQFNRDSLYDR